MNAKNTPMSATEYQTKVEAKRERLAERAAKDLSHRAETYGTHGISSDDPSAIDALKAKRLELERQRDLMKAANKEVAKSPSTTPTKHGRDGKPYPGYKLTNIGARIRDCTKRIEALASRTTAPVRKPHAIGDVQVIERRDLNRCQIVFPGKLNEDVRARLKSAGFRWTPSENAWQRQWSEQAWVQAIAIVRNRATP